MSTHGTKGPGPSDLRRRAEAYLAKGKRRGINPRVTDPESRADAMRLVHELHVQQIEIEMQNVELAEARDRLEALLEKYRDLYDFAPIGYFSLDRRGRILEVNLTGVTLLGVERGRLVGSNLTRFVDAASRPVFRGFLEKVFSNAGSCACELAMLKGGGLSLPANLQGSMATSLEDRALCCRLAVSDVSAVVEAREAQLRVESLSTANRELTAEVERRQAVERALKRSQQKQARLLKESRTLQKQMRQVSHDVLRAQEEERKRISRELHDEVSQVLVSIHVQLETLVREAAVNPGRLRARIAATQRLLQDGVKRIHAFACDLRPTQLDDLGLIPSLQALLKEFSERTGVGVHFAGFAGVQRLSGVRRTVLYRVAQSALSNVARHAHASQVTVRITGSGSTVRMEIADNGSAFDVGSVLRRRAGIRLGLLGMRERVEMVGGRFAVTSAPGKGTTVRVEIPRAS